MKRLQCLLACIILLCIVTTGCIKQDSAKLELKYTTYEIKELQYLPAFSSSTAEYFLEKNLGTVFSISPTSFSTDTTHAAAPAVNEVNYDDVIYIQEELINGIKTMGDDDIGIKDVSEYKEKVCYKVMFNNEDTGFRIYCLDSDVWIAHFSWFGEKQDAWWADYIFSVK